MTRFLPSEIPEQIQTIEQLMIWGNEILQNLYPNQTVVAQIDPQTGEDIKVRQVEANKFYYTAPEIPEWRYTARQEIKLHSDHQRYGRLWDHALSFGDLAIPQQMKKQV